MTDALLGQKAPNIEELMKGAPDVLQLAIYATSMGLHRILDTYGFQPTVAIGHSLGEISAMVCAGAFTLRDGAAIVCHRVQALKALGDDSGYMVALGVGATRTRRMLDLLEVKRSAIAVENEDRQTVVSGDEKELDAVTELGEGPPHPGRSHLLALSVPQPRARTDHSRLRRAPARHRGASAHPAGLLADPRAVLRGDDRLTEHLAAHLTQPVRFGAAIWMLRDQGINRFVECGALDALSRIVRRILAESRPEVIPCLVPGPVDLETLASAIETLTGRVVGMRPIARDLGDLLPTDIDATTMGAFFAEHGDRVQAFVLAEFEAFRAARGIAEAAPAEVEAPEAPEPVAAGDGRPSVSRDELLAELVTLYATALEYPEEVFTEEVTLEAELGVDSVKQAELMARVAERYDMPPRPEDFRLGDYDTLGKVTDFVYSQLGGPVASLA